jgi:hypothetical protein
MACGDIDNGNGVFLLFASIADAESHAVFMLYGVSRLVAWRRVYRFVVLAEEIAEVGDCVLRIADELALSLTAGKFFAFDIGQSGGDLAVSIFVGNDLCFTFTTGISNGAVRIAKGYSYRDSLRGVRLRTHLARGDVVWLCEEVPVQNEVVQF